MSLYVSMPKVESRFEFCELLTEYGKLRAEIEAKNTRMLQIKCALIEVCDKALEPVDKKGGEG